ncbi:MAG: aminotransferase class I/II-fold pyridoxal phosphate-dependent enzyme [Planctomycetia bacterium]|nr:aminotransferase class I/II-fold pyridoxal phosphate-dependent enzyme [Planctomycetia bacterium]
MNYSFSYKSNKINQERLEIDKMFQLEGPPDSTVTIGGKDYLYFAGDDYLSFQTNPEILSSACEAVLRFGISSAPFQSKYIPSPIHNVEKMAAELYQTDNAIYCSSNEKAFEILIESIQSSFDRIFVDECCQDSQIKMLQHFLDSKKQILFFKHNDPNHLDELLQKYLQPKERPLLIVDGIFPFTGKIAPVDLYFNILKNYEDASLIIDDSHSLGILGENGCGILEHFGYQTNKINQTAEDLDQSNLFDTDFHLLNQYSSDNAILPEKSKKNRFQVNANELSFDYFNKERFIQTSNEPNVPKKPLPVKTYLIASLSKAIGGFGGIIPGSESFVERLREALFQQNDSIPPTPIAAATAKGLHLSLHNKSIRQKLLANAHYLKDQMRQVGFAVEENLVPILVLNLGTNQNMRRIHQYMFDNNIIISFDPNQKYQGAKGILRTTLLAMHEPTMLDALIHVFCKAIQ